jgi:hypothetical protein
MRSSGGEVEQHPSTTRVTGSAISVTKGAGFHATFSSNAVDSIYQTFVLTTLKKI